jgi:hypothetical protein
MLFIKKYIHFRFDQIHIFIVTICIREIPVSHLSAV